MQPRSKSSNRQPLFSLYNLQNGSYYPRFGKLSNMLSPLAGGGRHVGFAMDDLLQMPTNVFAKVTIFY